MRDESMSLYEFVGRLYMHLRDFEGTLDEAHEKIDEFIARFDTKLDKTTEQILTEWKNDGTLAELINLVWEGKAEQILTGWKNDGTLAELINLVWEDKADKTYVDSLSQEVTAHKEDYANYIDSELDFILRELPNRIKDEIKVSGGKAELVQRVSNDFSLAGQTNWVMGDSLTDTVRFYKDLSEVLPNASFSSDGTRLTINRESWELNTVTAGIDSELHSFSNYSIGLLRIRIKKSRLSDVSPEGFANYLNTNTVTLNYQLAEPIITELTLDDLSANTQQIVKLSSRVEKLTNAIVALGGTIV